MIGAELARPTMALMGQSIANGFGGGAAAVNPGVPLADQYFDAQIESASLSGDGSLSLGEKLLVFFGVVGVGLLVTRKK